MFPLQVVDSPEGIGSGGEKAVAVQEVSYPSAGGPNQRVQVEKGAV